MTRNQIRACQLAAGLLSNQISIDAVSDSDWALLLLAADLHAQPLASPLVVARRVVRNRQAKGGYFENMHSEPVRLPMLAPALATALSH